MTSSANRTGKSPSGRSALIWIQVALGLLLLAVVGGSLWRITLQQGASLPNLPHQLAGLTLTRAVTGREALEELRQLHGKDTGVIGGWVAHYQEGATIWVGEAQDTYQAGRLLEAMRGRIETGNTPFAPQPSLQIDGETVYAVSSGGQRHYYLQRGAKLIWIATPSQNERGFLSAALDLVQ